MGYEAISKPVDGASLCVLSLGAGVQSSVMALMAARREIGPMPDVAIFADTGWEPQGVYDHLDWLRGQLPFSLLVIGGHNIRDDMLAGKNTTGQRFASMPTFTTNGGIGRRQCTSEYKIRPIQQSIRSLLGVGHGKQVTRDTIVEQWIGISTDELARVKDARPKWLHNRWPLIELDMSRHACLRWFARNYPSRALAKSACVGCPYRTDSEWRAMRDGDPQSWEGAVAFDKAIRNGGTMVGSREYQYLHRSCIPIAEVDLSTPKDRGQREFGFLQECDGLCGV